MRFRSLGQRITNRTTLQELLREELSDVYLDPDLAVKLDPSMKTKQIEAMSNGDIFIPEPPPFEIFNTQVTHGWDKEKIEAYVFGIKCAIKHARIIKEFFTQLGNLMEMDTRIGVFIPTGTVHLIGVEAYKKVLCKHNKYIQLITTIPVGDFQHATLDIPFAHDQNMDIDTTNLYETILDQPWCLSVEKMTTTNKVLIVTTKGQLLQAHEWVDNKLPEIYQQNVADKLDITMLHLLLAG